MSVRIRKRKSDHIKICLEKDVQVQNASTGFEDVFFIHRALPEIDKEKVDLSLEMFSHRFSAPLIVGAMTGGTPLAEKINSAIAEAVEELGLGMGVGSQRIAIEDETLQSSFSIAREKAPTAFLIANIGGAQLIKESGVEAAGKAVEMIQADALAIHLNPLQEAIQPEGETMYSGVLDRINEISGSFSIPVLVKETGAGISSEDAVKLEGAGVKGVDVAGVGGTSWAAVEYYRSKKACDDFRQSLGETFWDWGIPTAVSIVEVVKSVRMKVIASGGIRKGSHVAKALALGAHMASFSYPMLEPATKNADSVKKKLKITIEELKNIMFLVGAQSLDAMGRVPVVITGRTAEWLKIRGFKPETYAKR